LRYVAAVIDLFSRPVVGWSMKAEMSAQLVTDPLLMAISRRGRPEAALPCSAPLPGTDADIDAARRARARDLRARKA
jgi:transposase InsO family protein